MKQKKSWENLFRKGKINWTIPDIAVINAVQLFKKRKFKRILDLGCGRGRHIVYLAKKNFFVVGSDISATALSFAQKWLEKEKISNYYLVEHDVIKLPFPDDYFDAVISINTIHHNPLNKIKKATFEIRKVLKKKGLFLVTISSIKDYKFGIGKRIERGTYVSDKGTIHHFFDENGVRSLFSKFRIIEIKERSEFNEVKTLIHKPIVRNIKNKNEKVNVCHWQILAEKV